MNHETTIARYLETGEYETALLLDFLKPGGMTTEMLNEALSREVRKREQRIDLSGIRPTSNLKSLARTKTGSTPATFGTLKLLQ